MKRKLNVNKTIAAIIMSNLVHLIVVIGILMYITYAASNNTITTAKLNLIYIFFYIIIFVTLFINSFFAVRNAILLIYTDSEYEQLKGTLSQVESLNNTLRAQRHDFMNHLQVVYSLMELDEYKEAVDYITQVYNDIQKVNNIIKTSSPAINALIQAKALDCEKRNIKTNIIVTSRLKELIVPSWEMCRVLGNIIDNAMFALEEKEGLKLIEIRIFQDIKSYGFIIQNNGPIISRNILSEIFEAGFTTKGDRGQGMGLSISKDIVENYGGQIEVKSSEDSTIFEISIPKR